MQVTEWDRCKHSYNKHIQVSDGAMTHIEGSYPYQVLEIYLFNYH